MFQTPWRNLRSVMFLTVHVAVVAYVIRSVAMPKTLTGLLIWVPGVIFVAVFLSWPIGRMIASAFEPGNLAFDPTCPRCGREVRRLIRPGDGLAKQTTGFRCVSCGATFREDGSRTWEMIPIEEGPVDPSGIAFLSDPANEEEIRFLDDPTSVPLDGPRNT